MRKIQHIWFIVFVLWIIGFYCFDFIYANQNKIISSQKADNIIQKVIDEKFTGLDKTYKQRDFLSLLNIKISQLPSENPNMKILQESVENKITQLEKQIVWVQKVIVWYSQQNREIYWYFRWDIEKDFLLITANSHGGYEYGTYLTALDLIDYFDRWGKTQWFIIPTLNPDGLQIAIDDDFSQWYYLWARSNANNVDINRNFCTKNYSSGEYVKSFWWESKRMSKGQKCSDEPETKVIDNIFRYFSFSHALDFHSLWSIIFIPDNWFQDQEVVDFALRTKNLLWKRYDFNPNIAEKVQRYEFDEWGKNIYTGFLSQYIYENFQIPAIVVEFQYHGRIQRETRNLKKLLPDL